MSIVSDMRNTLARAWDEKRKLDHDHEVEKYALSLETHDLYGRPFTNFMGFPTPGNVAGLKAAEERYRADSGKIITAYAAAINGIRDKALDRAAEKAAAPLGPLALGQLQALSMRQNISDAELRALHAKYASNYSFTAALMEKGLFKEDIGRPQQGTRFADYESTLNDVAEFFRHAFMDFSKTDIAEVDNHLAFIRAAASETNAISRAEFLENQFAAYSSDPTE